MNSIVIIALLFGGAILYFNRDCVKPNTDIPKKTPLSKNIPENVVKAIIPETGTLNNYNLQNYT